IRGAPRMPGRRIVRLDQCAFRAAARLQPRRDPIAARLSLHPAPDVTDLIQLARTLTEHPRAVTLFGAPEGHDAATIGALLAESGTGTWLHVCRDDGRMARFAAALAFFHPGINTLSFPAWDCLPYDRVSPNGEITSRRIDTLTRLASGAETKPLVVLTTVNALVQRVPPRR